MGTFAPRSNRGARGQGNLDVELQPCKTLIQFQLMSSPKWGLALRSSKTDLLQYFAEWDRQLQIRCAVEGNTNGSSYSGFALKPVPKERLPSKTYRYTIYAFIGLKADGVLAWKTESTALRHVSGLTLLAHFLQQAASYKRHCTVSYPYARVSIYPRRAGIGRSQATAEFRR